MHSQLTDYLLEALTKRQHVIRSIVQIIPFNTRWVIIFLAYLSNGGLFPNVPKWPTPNKNTPYGASHHIAYLIYSVDSMVKKARPLSQKID